MVHTKGLLIPCLAMLVMAGCSRDEIIPATPEALEAIQLVPAGASLVAYVDAGSMAATAQALAEADHSGEMATMWDSLRQVMSLAGVDPAQDLRYALVYASQEGPMGAMLSGTFDVSRVSNTMATHMPQMVLTEFDDILVWTPPADSGQTPPVLGLLRDGTRAYAARTLEALSTNRQTPTDQTALMDLAVPVMGHDLWVVVRDVQEIAPPEGPSSDTQVQLTLKAVSRLAMGANVDTERVDGLALLNPAGDVSPKDLASLIRGVLAAARIQELPPPISREFESITVTHSRGQVRVSGSLSRAAFEALDRE